MAVSAVTVAVVVMRVLVMRVVVVFVARRIRRWMRGMVVGFQFAILRCPVTSY